MAFKDYLPTVTFGKQQSPAIIERITPTITSEDKGLPAVIDNDSGQVIEKKSLSLLAAMGDFGMSFADYLGGTNGDLRALEAIRLYKNCTPFFQAVSMRAEAFSSIPIRV